MRDPLTYEKELLLQMAAGSEDAFTILFNTYWPQIYSASLVISKSVVMAEDVSQEVFARLWQARANADKIESVKSYLFILARNLVLNKLSRLKTEQAYQHHLVKDYLPAANAERSSFTALNELLQSAIAQLPAQQQRAFRLSRDEGLSYEQVAAEMRISRETVKEHIAKALATLRRLIQQNKELLLYLIFINI